MTPTHSSNWAAQLGADADELATMNDQELLETVDSQAAIESMFRRVRIPDDEEPGNEGRQQIHDLPSGYTIQRKLGTGGFGEVLLASDEQLGRSVAIKRMRADRWAIAEDSDELLHEARTVAKLAHPGIVTLHEVKYHRNQWHLISEFVAGGTLADQADTFIGNASQVAAVGAQIARALAYAHRHSVIHRDLKLSNVLMTEDGQPRLTDFGLAVDDNSQARIISHAVGTLRYLAPEQLPGASSFIDGRVDIWALGVVLYRLMTGHFPFGDGDIGRAELFQEIRERSPKPPAQYDASIPAELSNICLKCLEKQPEDRYDSADGVAISLERLQSVPTRFHHLSRRKIFAAGSITLALVLAYLMTPVTSLVDPRTDDRLETQPSIMPQGKSKMPNRIELFQIQHYRFHPNSQGEPLGLLGRDTDHALFGDEIRVAAAFRHPAHVGLLEITPAAEIIVQYHTTDEQLDQNARFSFPLDAYSTLVLNDRPGPSLFALLISEAPIRINNLTAEQILGEQTSAWRDLDLNGVWRYSHDDAGSGFFFQERSTIHTRRVTSDLFERVCKRIEQAIPDAQLSAIVFPVRAN